MHTCIQRFPFVFDALAVWVVSTEVFEKWGNLGCGMSEGCRLNYSGIARHGGLGAAVRSRSNVDNGRCILTYKPVAHWSDIFLPRLVNNWLNMRVSVVILLRLVYKCTCIYKLVAQSLGKSSFLGSHWTDHADLWPL